MSSYNPFVQHDATPGDSVLSDALVEPGYALSGQYVALEDPKQRPAAQKFVSAARPHPGDMGVFLRLAARFLQGSLALLPVQQILDALGTHAQLNKMKARL